MAIKRVYNDDKTSFTDYDEKGNMKGAGLAGTENWASNPSSANMGDITPAARATLGKSSGGGSSNSYGSNIQSEIERLRKAQTDAAIASLGKARDNSLSNLSAERAKIEPLYYGKRNAASTGSQLGAKNFAEFMASRGGVSSGANAQAELSRQGALQGNIGSLNRDEATAFTENDRQVTNVNNAYESDVAGAQANAFTQYLQNMIGQMNQDRSFNQADRQFDMNYGLQRDQFGLAQQGQMQDQAYRVEALQLQKDAQTWQQQFQERGFTADEAYRAAQLKLQQEQQALDEKHRYSRSSGGSGSGGGGSITQSSNQGKINTDDAIISIQEELERGNSPGNIAVEIERQRDTLKRQGINVDALMNKVWELAGVITKPGEL